MAGTMLSADSVVDLPPKVAFGLFGGRGSGSWLLDARCDSVEVGAPVRLTLPNGGHDVDGESVELLGRITAIRPPSMIVVDHSQPWRGRIRLQFDPSGPSGTRIRVSVEVSPAGVEWLVQHRGGVIPAPPLRPGVVRIGLIASKTGPAALCVPAAEYLAELAVDEINVEGGLAGREVELLVADDGSNPWTAEREAKRLVRLGCRVIFACVTSASFTAITRSLPDGAALLVHATTNERENSDSPCVVRIGEQPAAQADAMVGRIMNETGGCGWFLVGQDYSWSFAAHRVTRKAIADAVGQVAGEVFTPLGTSDFSEVIEAIRRSGADLVMSSLVGRDEMEFQRQFAASGLRSETGSLSLLMDESTLENIGPSAEGIWTAQAYFQDTAVPGNGEFLKRYRSAHGRWAPSVSTLTQTVYEAIHLYARAVHVCPDDHPRQQGRAFVEAAARRVGAAVGGRDLLSPRLYLAEARMGRFRIFDDVE
ncbi:ABC transporter substrate-binding protein [Geodermatophilus sabuli]|nr:ABC transporter substrate-binding protein [Geodermatophilus sabuli]MBB3084641.1 branched-chain amino acid transport system substrate-binding protein [Geodermatophilus sabuli]